MNWLKQFLFLVLLGGPLIILIDCMIFLSPFIDVIMMSKSAVHLLAQFDSAILYQQNIVQNVVPVFF